MRHSFIDLLVVVPIVLLLFRLVEIIALALIVFVILALASAIPYSDLGWLVIFVIVIVVLWHL